RNKRMTITSTVCCCRVRLSMLLVRLKRNRLIRAAVDGTSLHDQSLESNLNYFGHTIPGASFLAATLPSRMRLLFRTLCRELSRELCRHPLSQNFVAPPMNSKFGTPNPELRRNYMRTSAVLVISVTSVASCKNP